MKKIKVLANTQGKKCDEKESVRAWRDGARVRELTACTRGPDSGFQHPCQ